MASSVHGMAFTAGDLSLENKEGETFSWHDTADEPSSGDFFEQYVMLDGGESGSPTGGGESFHHGELGKAADMAAFSPLVSEGITLPPGRPSGAITHQDDCTTSIGSSSHAASAYASEFFQLQQQQRRQVRVRPNMSHHHSTIEQRGVSMAATYEMTGGGSISDSELLKLEGLTMLSPRAHVPPTSASVPPSPHSKSNSPRKVGRFEAIYAKVRSKAATLHGKSRQQSQQPPPKLLAPTMSTAQMGSGPTRTGKSKPYNLQIDKPHLPLSPPLTGSMTNLAGHATTITTNNNGDSGNDNDNGMQFINGFLDDPFFEPNEPLMSMSQPNGNNNGAGPNTPLNTPLLANFTSSASEPSQQPAIVWQLGLDGKTLWSPTTMAPGPMTAPMSSFLDTPDGNNNWWDGADAMDTDDVEAAVAAFQQQNAQNRNLAALNIAMQQLHQQQNQQQQEGGFEYPPLPQGGSVEDFAASGLMIHMPQPRPPASVVLNTYYPGAGLAISQNGDIINGGGGGGGGGANRQTRTSARSEQRQSKRPQPRAPSSGARYHHHQPSGAMTSPRKTRTASGSGASGGRTTPSPSPTPGGSAETGTAAPSRRLHRRSASMNTLNSHGGIGAGVGAGGENPTAIRKRRSWTGRKLGATEAAAAAAAVSVATAIPPVPAVPPGMLPQQQQQHRGENGSNNIARRVSSVSSLSSSSRATAMTTGNISTRNNSLVTTVATTPGRRDSQQQLNHGHMLRNNRSMPHLTLPPDFPPGMPSLSDDLIPQQQQQPTSSPSRSRHQKSSRKDHHHHDRKSSHGGGGGGGGAGLGFVNFTPKDHNILMTGVAPSGSSKTKARREKEAAEKQRRMSEAVVKAVVAAGGDVTKLEQQGIMLS